MLTVQNTTEFRISGPTIVTIGTFDGVHLGHQKILARLRSLKEETGFSTVVLTFDPHPRKVLFPAQTDLRLLTSVEEKLDMLRAHGVDVAVVYPFDEAFARLSAEQYIAEILKKSLATRRLVIGYDHKFGSGRKGGIETLRAAEQEFGFKVEEISALDVDHIAVSSSKIRKALEEGDVKQARQLLGYHYTLTATVVEGKKLGRTLGYPTANLEIDEPDKLIPATGIYFTEVQSSGRQFSGMMSIGYNPTTDHDNRIKCEVHLFNFDGDLYGKELKVSIIRRIRSEKKFDSLEELKQALEADKKQCKDWLKAC